MRKKSFFCAFTQRTTLFTYKKRIPLIAFSALPEKKESISLLSPAHPQGS
jgi:hypothetical protein